MSIQYKDLNHESDFTGFPKSRPFFCCVLFVPDPGRSHQLHLITGIKDSSFIHFSSLLVFQLQNDQHRHPSSAVSTCRWVLVVSASQSFESKKNNICIHWDVLTSIFGWFCVHHRGNCWLKHKHQLPSDFFHSIPFCLFLVPGFTFKWKSGFRMNWPDQWRR